MVIEIDKQEATLLLLFAFFLGSLPWELVKQEILEGGEGKEAQSKRNLRLGAGKDE